MTSEVDCNRIQLVDCIWILCMAARSIPRFIILGGRCAKKTCVLVGDSGFNPPVLRGGDLTSFFGLFRAFVATFQGNVIAGWICWPRVAHESTSVASNLQALQGPTTFKIKVPLHFINQSTFDAAIQS